jgi:hypothetical protein
MGETSTGRRGEDLACRRAERKAISKQTEIWLSVGAGEPVQVPISIEDFSAFGIGMTCDVSLERGQQFTMQLCPSNGPAAGLLYSVAYCHPLLHGRFRIGAEFICIAGNSETPIASAKSEGERSTDRIRAAILG